MVSPNPAYRTEETVFGENPHISLLLHLSLDLGNFTEQIPEFISFEFGGGATPWTLSHGNSGFVPSRSCASWN